MKQIVRLGFRRPGHGFRMQGYRRTAGLRELCRLWVWPDRIATGLPVFGFGEGRLHIALRLAQPVGCADVEPFPIMDHAEQAICVQRSIIDPIEGKRTLGRILEGLWIEDLHTGE